MDRRDADAVHPGTAGRAVAPRRSAWGWTPAGSDTGEFEVQPVYVEEMTIASVGDMLESAIWLDGTETMIDRVRFQGVVVGELNSYCRRYGLELGPVTWAEKVPGDPRVPPVPEHIQGPGVRLLVAEAEVIGNPGIVIAKPGFAHDLEPEDLAILRRVTRKRYRQQYPNRKTHPDPTDAQCDTLINDLGPDAALDTMRAATPGDLH